MTDINQADGRAFAEMDAAQIPAPRALLGGG